MRYTSTLSGFKMMMMDKVDHNKDQCTKPSGSSNRTKLTLSVVVLKRSVQSVSALRPRS